MLGAVDFHLRFKYVLAGWEGSAHDARIPADALERGDGLRVPLSISCTQIQCPSLCSMLRF